MRRGKKRLHIHLYDRANACVGTYTLMEFPMPEEIIIALSVQYFDDPEPCHIHRAAVLTRAMEELLKDCEIGKQYLVDALPAERRLYFDENYISAFAIREATAL